MINEFFSSFSMSTDPSAAGSGLDIEGRYVEGTKVVKPSTSLATAADLSTYLLTYAAGHTYYSNGSSPWAWGLLEGGSWHAFVQARAKPLARSVLNADTVLLVEGAQNASGYPVCVSTAGSFDVLGIVVRRGGVLLIDDVDATVTTQFVLVESGGLLQAGSSAQSGYRLRSKLSIVLTHPPGGYADMGVVASQYSYTVYAPGVEDVGSENFTLFTGSSMAFNNCFGAKAISDSSIFLLGTPSLYLLLSGLV